METLLLMVGYGIGLSVWAYLGLIILRPLFVAGRHVVRGAAEKRVAIANAAVKPEASPAGYQGSVRVRVPDIRGAIRRRRKPRSRTEAERLASEQRRASRAASAATGDRQHLAA